MGQRGLTLELATEPALERAAAASALTLRERLTEPFTLGLSGDLGAGKTTWVRAMLRALGHTGRVPSPTYTLLERYALANLTLVHLDLYRLTEPLELEYLGLRDWLGEPDTWIVVEWPERGGGWLEQLDCVLRLEITGPESRSATLTANTPGGRRALDALVAANLGALADTSLSNTP